MQRSIIAYDVGRRGKQAMVEAGMTGRRSTVTCYVRRPNQKYWKSWTQSLHDKDEIVSETESLRELLRPQSYESELGNWLLRWIFFRESTSQGWSTVTAAAPCSPLKKRLHSVGTAPHNTTRRRCSILHKHFCSEVLFLIWDTRSYSW